MVRFRPPLTLSVVLAATVSLVVAGCSSNAQTTDTARDRPIIVVSHAVLGAVTAQIAGGAADVVVLIPNGVDPHAYEPSAKDIEALNSADLIVVNGLGLEARLEDSLTNARTRRIPIFVATDHIVTHSAREERGHLHSDDDPHFWTDPRLMAEVVDELGDAIFDLGIDIGDRALMFSERLLTLDQNMLSVVETLPVERRVLVTGHESLGYFAERYGFEIVGTVVPGLSSGAEVSAGNLSDVKEAIQRSGVDVVFTELGTPTASARTLADELGVEIVEISTHVVPDAALDLDSPGERYVKYIEVLVETIVSALAE